MCVMMPNGSAREVEEADVFSSSSTVAGFGAPDEATLDLVLPAEVARPLIGWEASTSHLVINGWAFSLSAAMANGEAVFAVGGGSWIPASSRTRRVLAGHNFLEADV